MYARVLHALKEYPPETFRFLTVTTITGTAEANDKERLRAAWKEFVRRMRRRHEVFEYIAVTETTKAGALHIHAIVRSPYIEQAEISEVWKAITTAYVVFISAIYLWTEDENGNRKRTPLSELSTEGRQQAILRAAGYISKYLQKQQKETGGKRRRTWISRNFDEKWNEERRLSRIGRDLDLRTTGKYWRDVKQRVLHGNILQAVRVREWLVGDETLWRWRTVMVRRRDLELVGNDQFLVMENGRLIVRDDEAPSDDLPDPRLFEDKFWKGLAAYLENIDWRAPPI